MSDPATLQATCIRKTCDLLMTGMWDACKENPFSWMPASVVENLLSCLWPKELEFLSKASLSHSRLLLTSGRLEHVTLSRAQDERDYSTLLRMLSLACKNLRSLSIICGRYEQLELKNFDVEHALQELLQNCFKLERLHSCIYFKPYHLRNCRKLKVLRFHFDESVAEEFFSDITSDLLERLESVEVFALCDRSILKVKDELRRTRVVAELLDHCPQLISLGFLDSSWALKELHDRDLKTLGAPRRVTLLRCYWIGGENMSQSEESDRIEAAALLCPMIEVLAIVLRHSICIRHLKTMKNLIRLTVYLYLDGDLTEFGRECVSLLREIGSQLRYLTVNSFDDQKLSVNALCGSFPNLRTLELIDCIITADGGVQTCANYLNLERLYVAKPDWKSLFFLLSNCPHLKVLYLESCMDLDDNAMKAILRKNPLAELEMALIGGCLLSELGCRRFLRSAVKLTECCLVTPLLSDDGVMRLVRDMNPSIRYHSGEDIDDLLTQQFPLEAEYSCLF